MIDKTDIYALSLIKGIGSKSLFRLLELGDTIQEICSLPEAQLKVAVKGKGASEAIAQLRDHFGAYQEKAEYEIMQLESQEVSLVSYSEEQYPTLYKKIESPPPFLFCKGNLQLLNQRKSVAIIGTRECSETGYRIAVRTAQRFAEKGYNIVSGLAVGIDTGGHRGALDAKGATTAVLVDVQKIYPKENQALADEIFLNNGLLLSENRPGAFMNKGAFVARDRLQSGLSVAVFPIETDVQGGTMHTVSFAQEQGRLLFCPDLKRIKGYDLSFRKALGIQMLLREGKAHPYSDANYDEVIASIENKIELLFSNSPHPAPEQQGPGGQQGSLNLQ